MRCLRPTLHVAVRPVECGILSFEIYIRILLRKLCTPRAPRRYSRHSHRGPQPHAARSGEAMRPCSPLRSPRWRATIMCSHWRRHGRRPTTRLRIQMPRGFHTPDWARGKRDSSAQWRHGPKSALPGTPMGVHPPIRIPCATCRRLSRLAGRASWNQCERHRKVY